MPLLFPTGLAYVHDNASMLNLSFNLTNNPPHFSDSWFGYCSAVVFSTAVSELQWLIQPPQPCSAIPPAKRDKTHKQLQQTKP